MREYDENNFKKSFLPTKHFNIIRFSEKKKKSKILHLDRVVRVTRYEPIEDWIGQPESRRVRSPNRNLRGRACLETQNVIPARCVGRLLIVAFDGLGTAERIAHQDHQKRSDEENRRTVRLETQDQLEFGPSRFARLLLGTGTIGNVLPVHLQLFQHFHASKGNAASPTLFTNGVGSRHF